MTAPVQPPPYGARAEALQDRISIRTWDDRVAEIGGVNLEVSEAKALIADLIDAIAEASGYWERRGL